MDASALTGDIASARMQAHILAAINASAEADKINNGQLDDLPTSKITSGTFNLDRIPTPLTGKDADSVDGCDAGIATGNVFKIPASIAQGDIFYVNVLGNVVRLAAGTNGHFLKTQGAATPPIWAAGAGGVTTWLALTDTPGAFDEGKMIKSGAAALSFGMLESDIFKKDGSVAMTGDLDMGDHNILNLINLNLVSDSPLIQSSTGAIKIDCLSRVLFDEDIFPFVTGSYDLGSNTYKWADVYGVNAHFNNHNLIAGDIPNLAASKITSGIFALGRIPTGIQGKLTAACPYTYSHPAARQCSSGSWAWASISGKPGTYPPSAHTLASHSSKAHSELTGVGASDHHAKTGDNEVKGLLQQGLIADRPAASIAGRLYYATDEGILYRDTNTGWEEKARAEASTRLAQLSERAHSSLTGIGASDHHAKTASGDIDHGSVIGLADDDHTQYYNSARHTKAIHDALAINAGQVDGIEGAEIFKKDGSVAMTGDLDMGDHNILNLINLNLVSDSPLIQSSTGAIKIDCLSRVLFDEDIFPFVTGSYDLGSNTYKWADVYGVNAHFNNHNLIAGDIPNLAASKITSGIFALGRIPTGIQGKLTAACPYTYSHPAARQCSSGSWAWASISGKPGTYPPSAHTLASHSSKAHSELTGVGASDHHAKTGDNEVKGLLQQGLIADRPAASIAGRLYYATDEGILYRDTNTGWEEKARAEASTRLAQLSERAHSSLTGIGASDHHAKTASGDIDHGSVIGLADDDHTQYYNSARHTKAIHDALAINAGQVDGIEGAEIFKKDGSVAMTGDLDMGDHGIGNISALQKYGNDGYLGIYGGLNFASRVNIHGKDYPTGGKAGRIYFPVTNAAKDAVEDAGYFEGVTDTPYLVLLHGLKTGVLSERVTDAGILVDSCLIKDGKAADSLKLEGSTKAQVQDHTPKAHETSHESGGSDELDFDQLADGTTYKKFLATERTKLSGIESGATADQTKADIDALGINAGQIDGIEGAAIFKKDGSVAMTGNLLPDNDATRNLGSASKVFQHTYTIGINSGGWSDVTVTGNLKPDADNTEELGKTGLRWSDIWGVTTHFGDLGFIEKECPICDKEFKLGDNIILKVIRFDEEEGGIMTIPIHAECADTLPKTFIKQYAVKEMYYVWDEDLGEIVTRKRNKTIKKNIVKKKIKQGYELDIITKKFWKLKKQDKKMIRDKTVSKAEAIEEVEEEIEEVIYEEKEFLI